jgi:hypothetical protein
MKSDLQHVKRRRRRRILPKKGKKIINKWKTK